MADARTSRRCHVMRGLRIARGITLAVLAVAPLHAAAAPTGDASSRPRGDHAALQRIVEDLAPIVEKAAGARFDELPEVVVADSDLLAQVVYEEQVYLLGALTDQSTSQSEEVARATADGVAHLFAGKYGFLDKRLYLSLDSIATALAERGADPRLAMPVVKIVLAHELTHALQDQRADLDTLVTTAPNGDAIMAANCLVEGHAVWVHEQVGAELGLHGAMDVMSDLLGYRSPGIPSDPAAFTTAYVYGLGRDFTAWHTAAGGTDRMWEVLLDPPEETAMIVHPERYGQASTTQAPGIRRALRRSRRRLGASRWSGGVQPLGDFDLREQLVLSGHAASADRVESAWRMRANDRPMHGIEVQVLRFAEARTASRYVHAMGRQAAYQAATVTIDPNVQAWTGVFDAVPADRSARERVVLELPGTREELSTVWLAQGPDVVQVISVNTAPTDRRLARALRPVLRSLRRTADQTPPSVAHNP